MKTLQMWKDAKIPLNKFLQIGDEVSYDIVAEQRDCIPPRTNDPRMMQTGESCDHVRGRPTYTTFVTREKDGFITWVYVGECHAGNDVAAVEFMDLEREGYHHLMMAQKAFADGGNAEHLEAVTELIQKIRLQKL